MSTQILATAICDELADQLKPVRNFDHRLGVLLTHKCTCGPCGDSAELLEWIDRMTTTRFHTQLQLRKGARD
ncbi:MAG: hypothetical protein HY646_14435 [Acidobacteria bacterium]|nr:hypothetical protein [Acidobacteriota bacterium]